MNRDEVGRRVADRRMELRLSVGDVARIAEVDRKTHLSLERGERWPRDSSRFKIEAALQWATGSLDLLAEGKEARPINCDQSETDRYDTVRPELPTLPRGAPNARVLGGLHQLLERQAEIAPADRALLTSARNKVAHGQPDLTDEERRVLTRFIEDNELRTLHVRIDWLPRPEQLEVSELVTDLEQRVHDQTRALGVTNEAEFEDLPPGFPMPNPLPRDGIAPDPDDFPSQVPDLSREIPDAPAPSSSPPPSAPVSPTQGENSQAGESPASADDAQPRRGSGDDLRAIADALESGGDGPKQADNA